ncbi:MAG: hypothetical protein JW914_10490 [Syntrophaceae bacterium]|nr:hypothetical protein [Syntrophaceae bacterium]
MYPKDNDIKGKWSKYQIISVVLSTLIIWPLFFLKLGFPSCHNMIPFISVLGLYLDILGVIIASIEAPYFGLFADGGNVEIKRARIKEKYLKIGLTLIGIGFLFQGIETIISQIYIESPISHFKECLSTAAVRHVEVTEVNKIMNETQTVFLVFFAIIWGVTANVQGRWKAFHWAFICRNVHARRRILPSMIYLNLLPIMYATFALWCLSESNITIKDAWSLSRTLHVMFFGILPAFAGFAPYRLWLSIIEKRPRYYYSKYNGKYITEQNGAKDTPLHITPEASTGNFWAGVGYLAFGMFLLLINCFMKFC